jgi:hypothetical protein
VASVDKRWDDRSPEEDAAGEGHDAEVEEREPQEILVEVVPESLYKRFRSHASPESSGPQCNSSPKLP